jgi:hypothetical protein
MNNILIQVCIAVVAVLALLAAFTGLVWFGFRMGRQVAGKPLAPIIKPKAKMLVEEDPYFEPMTGARQPSIPTIKEGR